MSSKSNSSWMWFSSKWKELHLDKQIELIVGILIVLFTAIMAVLAYLQYAETRKASSRELRAYMAVWEPRLDSVKVIGDSIQYFGSYNEGNLGSTPAYHVFADKRLGTVDTNDLADPMTFEPRSPPIVVGAHLQTRYETHSPRYGPTGKDTVGSHSGERLFLYGKIVYEDVFERRQWLTFCFVYQSIVKEFHAYVKYNEASRD
jgi:hypothetical protein